MFRSVQEIPDEIKNIVELFYVRDATIAREEAQKLKQSNPELRRTIDNVLSLFEDAPDGVFLFYDRLIALQSEEDVLDESFLNLSMSDFPKETGEISTWTKSGLIDVSEIDNSLDFDDIVEPEKRSIPKSLSLLDESVAAVPTLGGGEDETRPAVNPLPSSDELIRLGGDIDLDIELDFDPEPGMDVPEIMENLDDAPEMADRSENSTRMERSRRTLNLGSSTLGLDDDEEVTAVPENSTDPVEDVVNDIEFPRWSGALLMDDEEDEGPKTEDIGVVENYDVREASELHFESEDNIEAAKPARVRRQDSAVSARHSKTTQNVEDPEGSAQMSESDERLSSGIDDADVDRRRQGTMWAFPVMHSNALDPKFVNSTALNLTPIAPLSQVKTEKVTAEALQPVPPAAAPKDTMPTQSALPPIAPPAQETINLNDGMKALQYLKPYSRIPRLTCSMQELLNRKDISARAGFLLSMIDGNTSIADIFDLSMLPDTETAVELAKLEVEKVIVFL